MCVFSRYAAAAVHAQQNHSLYFDWANSLYRYGKEKQGRGDVRQAAEKLVQACSCYAKSLSIRRTLEAWINLGVALERAASVCDKNQVRKYLGCVVLLF